MSPFSLSSLLPIAHGSIDGLGDVWNGVLHPLRSPAQCLVLLGLGLLAGQRFRFRAQILWFLTGAFGGLLQTQIPNLPELPISALCLLSASLGAAVALRKPISKPTGILIFATAGWILGWDSIPEPAPVFKIAKLLVGIWVGLGLILSNLANYAALCPRKAWCKIAFRILGSWITAISFLYLAFSLRGKI